MEKNFMSSKEKNITFYQVWEWIQKNRVNQKKIRRIEKSRKMRIKCVIL